MRKLFAPRGIAPGDVQHRFASAKPSTYNETERSVEAVLSTGADVQRAFGVERLSIKPSAVDLSRLSSNAVPLLDTHNATSIKTTLGRVANAWFSGGKLIGKLIFFETPEGRRAEQMVARREVSSVSIGYTISKWKIYDGDGDEIDPQTQRINWDDNLVFEAVRWQLVECSLVSTPADPAASIRSLGSGDDRRHVKDVMARMRSRQRMHERMRDW
jgi:phage head maturation protease